MTNYTALRERLEDGRDRVVAHCMSDKGGALMSIPVNKECDIDVLLQDAHDAITELEAEVKRANAEKDQQYQNAVGMAEELDQTFELAETAEAEIERLKELCMSEAASWAMKEHDALERAEAAEVRVRELEAGFAAMIGSHETLEIELERQLEISECVIAEAAALQETLERIERICDEDYAHDFKNAEMMEAFHANIDGLAFAALDDTDAGKAVAEVVELARKVDAASKEVLMIEPLLFEAIIAQSEALAKLPGGEP